MTRYARDEGRTSSSCEGRASGTSSSSKGTSWSWGATRSGPISWCRDVEVSPEHAGIVREPERGSYVLRGLGEGHGVNGEVMEGERAAL